MKEEVSIRLITRESELPHIQSHSFFHSAEFFRILEATPMQEPCMAVAEDSQGNIVGHMLTTVFYHRSLLPPAIYSHGRVYGEGEYDESRVDKAHVFGQFLKAVTTRFSHHLCLYIEFSHMSGKMFGYKAFKQCGYFPVQWQEIHNSLHSLDPMERLSEHMKELIAGAERRGVATIEAKPQSRELADAYRLLRHHFVTKPRRSIPHIEMFRQLAADSHCHIYATMWRQRVIGTCVCVYSNGNAYMWHLASRRKSHAPLHPATYTVWTALREAHAAGMRHMYFLDAGMPFHHSRLRDFILRFGGMPVTKYRWFRTPFTWFNRMADWLYND